MFAGESSQDAARLVAVAALGMCVAVREGGASAAYACEKLFRPKLLQRLRELQAEESLCATLEAALELEDVHELARHAFGPPLDRLIAELVAYLRSASGAQREERRCWVSPVE